MLGRRFFLISCGSLLAGLAPARSPGAEARPLFLPQQGPEVNETPAIELRIAGWDAPRGSGPDARTEVWISLNGSWRSAWR